MNWNKLFSGRYFLTICCGLVFIYAAWAGKLNEATIAAIITSVFTNYFNKKDTNA
jgi:hypothetical protein